MTKVIDARAVIGNTKAKIKLHNLGTYTDTCGTSDSPNDRGVGKMTENGQCEKLGFVVVEANQKNHWGLWNRRQTTILQKNGEVHVWNDGGGLSGATMTKYNSLNEWMIHTGKTLTNEAKEEIERVRMD